MAKNGGNGIKGKITHAGNQVIEAANKNEGKGGKGKVKTGNDLRTGK